MLVKTAAQHDELPRIELTPIIDMVFLLLVFFLVASTLNQTEREMQIALPEAESAGPISLALRELVVNVRADGSISVGGRDVSSDELRTIVRERVAGNPDQKVTIRGDQAASYQAVAHVLDICKASGVAEPFLDTVPAR